jgi:hypothetical protein
MPDSLGRLGLPQRSVAFGLGFGDGVALITCLIFDQMTSQLLFYNDVAPISSERHRDWHVRELKDYSFANKVNAVPLMAVEFLNASSDFPIVFAGDEETVTPMLLLGMRKSENVFIGSDGSWEGKYIPAFVRRYPFVFSRSENGESFYLCIDESYPGFNQDGEGPALIGEDGKPSEYTDRVLEFLSQYQSEFQRTQAICKQLKDLNLLERKKVDVTLPDGKQLSLTGFFTADRSRLATLSSDAIVELVRSGAYELICHHLASLRNFEALRDRSSDAQPAGDEQEAT